MGNDTTSYRVIILDSKLEIDPSFNKVILKDVSRHQESFIIAAQSPQQLFPLWESISAGIFDHLVVSGDNRYLIFDSVNYCKRLLNLPIVFHYIEDIDELAHVFNEPNSGTKNAFFKSVFSDVEKLRLLPESTLLTFERFRAALEPHPLPALPNTPLSQSVNFFSVEGVKRLGGLKHLYSANWMMGDQYFKQYTSTCLLDFCDKPSVEESENLVVWPVVTNKPDVAPILFDLCPAPEHPLLYSASSDFEDKPDVRLPRFILVGRLMSSNFELSQNSDEQALFIMSSYNKEDYITAAIWSVAQQTYEKVSLSIIDDNSEDTSMLQVKSFLRAFPVARQWLSYASSERSMGTYAIRNKVINEAPENCIYLINDADDLSSAVRASIQVQQMLQTEVTANIGDIVRLSSDYNTLSFDNHVEHYGSASLASSPQAHQHLGYFQNLRKGADTEYINRVQYFLGNAAFTWLRYPLLFQTFGQRNLTEDIYTIERTQLVEKAASREQLFNCFATFHAQTSLDELPKWLVHDACFLPNLFDCLADEFFVNRDAVTWLDILHPTLDLTGLDIANTNIDGWSNKLTNLSTDAHFKLESRLEGQEHQYLYLSKPFNIEELAENSERDVFVYFETLGNLGISAVLVYLNSSGEQISHQFFWANHKMPVKMPPACKSIKLGFRLQGAGSAEVKRICFTTLHKFNN